MTSIIIDIGQYSIMPHEDSDGRVLIKILRMDCWDEHDHPHGPETTIDVAKLFENEPKWE